MVFSSPLTHADFYDDEHYISRKIFFLILWILCPPSCSVVFFGNEAIKSSQPWRKRKSREEFFSSSSSSSFLVHFPRIPSFCDLVGMGVILFWQRRRFFLIFGKTREAQSKRNEAFFALRMFFFSIPLEAKCQDYYFPLPRVWEMNFCVFPWPRVTKLPWIIYSSVLFPFLFPCAWTKRRRDGLDAKLEAVSRVFL